MKIHHSPRGGRLTRNILLGCFMCAATLASEVPTGSIQVDRNMIREGSFSQLDWKIQYPAAETAVTDVIEILPPNIIRPRRNLKMKVRLLGASFQQDVKTFLPVEVQWNKNNSSWSRIFYGTQLQVNANTVVLNTDAKLNDRISFGGRGFRGNWLPFYHTSTATQNLVMLKNGDKVPSTVPAMQQGNIESFLAPYLQADKKTVKIGNRDLIFLLELGQTNRNASGFDLQDLVFLVTFE